jgi:hypothetical protein
MIPHIGIPPPRILVFVWLELAASRIVEAFHSPSSAASTVLSSIGNNNIFDGRALKSSPPQAEVEENKKSGTYLDEKQVWHILLSIYVWLLPNAGYVTP